MARRKIIPKRIGGVKIPKRLRKLGDAVLSDPRAREAAGSALLALGTTLLARRTAPGSIWRDILESREGRPRSPREAGAQAASHAGEAASRAGEAVSGVAEAVTQAVGEVIDGLRRDFARKIRPVRPRHAHDEEAEEERPEGADDRMH